MVVGGRELIDTLWNVNRTLRQVLIFCPDELIDTLWNVNAQADVIKRGGGNGN